MHWIRELNTRENGYNETDGGEGSWNRVISEETKSKHRKNAIERYKDPKFREKISETTKSGMKKWWQSLSEQEKTEHVERCKKRPDNYVPHRGHTYTHTDEAKRRISEAHKGKSLSESSRKKISDKNKGKLCGINNPMANKEYRKKVSQSKLGRKRLYQPDGTFKYVFPDNAGTI